MNIKEQVTSLELSRKLKILGVKQESLFYWIPGEKYPKMIKTSGISAFNVAELGEMLPAGTCCRDAHKHHKTAIRVDTDILDEKLERYCLYLAGDNHYVQDKSEANARAKMLIYLIENKIIRLGKKNKK